MNGILVLHPHLQDAELYFWRVADPSDPSTKERIMQELNSTPYSVHLGIQRTLGKVRRSFFWKGMTGAIRSFVERCPVCQMEKSDITFQRASCSPSKFQKRNGVRSS